MTRTTIVIKLDTRNELRQYGRKAQTYDDIVKDLLKKAEESIDMTAPSSFDSSEINEFDEDKVICNGFDCQELATEQLELQCGEYGSTIFFLCKNCNEKIENLGGIQS